MRFIFIPSSTFSHATVCNNTKNTCTIIQRLSTYVERDNDFVALYRFAVVSNTSKNPIAKDHDVYDTSNIPKEILTSPYTALLTSVTQAESRQLRIVISVTQTTFVKKY